MIEVQPYRKEMKIEWDQFVDQSKNSHFFFKRAYMEYHSDRFSDASLFFLKDSKIIAILPATHSAGLIECHGGLTFGYFLISKDMTSVLMLKVFESAKNFWKASEIKELIYKPAPYIFHLIPAQEDLYCLFRNDAKLFRRDLSVAIDYSDKLEYQERRIRGARKAAKTGLMVIQTQQIVEFWKMLSVNLEKNHAKKPVHSETELSLLMKAFPENIKLFVAVHETNIFGGVLIFENKTIAHAQYIASTEDGRKIGAIDLIFDYVIKYYERDKRYFSFGISTEDQGRYLNEGLVDQKEGFGARAVTHDFYSVTIK